MILWGVIARKQEGFCFLFVFNILSKRHVGLGSFQSSNGFYLFATCGIGTHKEENPVLSFP